MNEERQNKKILDQAKKFKSRANESPEDSKRHDLIQPDEQKMMRLACNKLGWSYSKIGSVFDRDPHSVRKTIEKYKQEEKLKPVTKDETKPHDEEIFRSNGNRKDNIDNIKFSVEPKVYGLDAMLEVTNQSQIEIFRGTLRIGRLEIHRLYWDGYGSEAKLGNGDTASVLIAHWEWRSQQMIAVHLIESASGNPSSFMPHLYKVQNGVIEQPDPIYLEVIIKPISSSKKEDRAYYAIEPSMKKPMVFHKIDSIPSPSHKEAEMHDKENLKKAIARSKIAGQDLIKNKSTEVRPDFSID